MKRLAQKRIKDLITEMEGSSVCGRMDLWDKWADQQGDFPAIVEFPCGELMNDRILGFVWAWGMKGKIQTQRIEKSDKFNAQGLEGKIAVRTTLTVALMVHRNLPAYRCQIKA